jgi:hypothetical protein
VKSDVEGQNGVITVRAEDDAFMTAGDIKGTLIDPDGMKQDIRLVPGTPGEYSGSFANLKSGVYVADITLTGSDGRSERISTGLIMPYSPEYDLLSGDDDTLLQKIIYEGGGRLLADPSEVFKSEPPPVSGTNDPSLAILIAVSVLFMLDIAIRRLNLHSDSWKRKLEPILASGKVAARKLANTASRRISSTGREIVRTKQEIAKAGEKRNGKENRIADNISKIEEAINVKLKIEQGSESKTNQSTESQKEKINMDSHISQLLDKKRRWKR